MFSTLLKKKKKLVYKKEKCQHQLLLLLFYKKSCKHLKKKIYHTYFIKNQILNKSPTTKRYLNKIYFF